MKAEENKAQYNLSGQWREIVFEMTSGANKKAYAGMKTDGSENMHFCSRMVGN